MIHSTSSLTYILLIVLGGDLLQQSLCLIERGPCNPDHCGGIYPTESRCSCEKYCYLYNECCSEKMNYTTAQTVQPPTGFSCRKVYTNENQTYFVYDRCPVGYPVRELVTYCESPDTKDQISNTPAFGKHSKRLYRNLFCALCNKEEYILWNIQYVCEKQKDANTSDFLDLSRSKECKVSFEAPGDFDFKYPCMNYVSNCSSELSNMTAINSCLTEPMALVSSNGIYYRNIHCAVCNGIDANDTECNVGIPVHTKSTYAVLNSPYPLTVIFNYNVNSMYQPHRDLYDTKLNCSTIRLNESEYHINADGSLYLNASKTLLKKSEYMQDSQGVSICIKNSTKKMKTSHVIASNISLVGLAFSLPALAITIIVYLCIPELHTLPGKLLISLLLSLFIAQLLFLISPQVTSIFLCIQVAVFMHYFYLAAFFWMNVMSFDAWYTFSGFTPLRSTDKNSKRFLYYSLYSWIFPLIIVSVSLLLQYGPRDHGFSPGYGKGLFCFITNRKARLCVFIVPIIIILFLNTLAFILTARGLCIASKNSTYLAVQNKTNYKIYFKLSLVMGLTWVLVFFPNLSEMTAIYIIACVLNSFLGFIISISFLSTKTVRRHFSAKCYKKCFKKFYQTDVSSSSNKTSSTNVHT